MSNDIRDILSKLTVLESQLTPTSVKHGLNAQQKSVPQLPALFKPKHIKALGAKTDPKHPMSDYFVGAESIEPEQSVDESELVEAQANEEKLLDKVKKSLTDYLTNIEQKYKDDNLSKKAQDRDLGKKDKIDHDLIPAQHNELEVESIAMPECGTAIKTITFEDGRMCEIHGDEGSGFAVKHGNNTLPSRFRTLDEAELAVEMYKARCRAHNESNDYIEER